MEYFQLRESDIDLIDSILELEAAVHHGKSGAFSKLEIVSFMRYGRLYAAVEENVVLCTVSFLRDFENPGKSMLYAVTQRPDANVAINLIESACADMKGGGLRMVEVMVSVANKRAVARYTKELGFSPINVSDGGEVDGNYLILRKLL